MRSRLFGLVGRLNARRIRAVDDIEVVIARNDQNALGELRMCRQSIVKLRPLRGQAGVCDISGNQDRIERMLGMNLIETRQRAHQAVIAARA